MASRDKDEANIEEVSSGVRYEKGNCVVLNGMSEPDLISKAGVKSGVHGSAQNIDDKVVNEKSGEAAAKVLCKLQVRIRQEREVFLKNHSE